MKANDKKPIIITVTSETLSALSVPNRSGFLNYLVETCPDFFAEKAKIWTELNGNKKVSSINTSVNGDVIQSIQDKIKAVFDFESSKDWRALNETTVAALIGENLTKSKEIMIAIRRLTGLPVRRNAAGRAYVLPVLR